MSLHFHRELDHLRKRILSISTMVENALTQAVTALQTRDMALAEKIIEGDREIDAFEIEVEEECLKVLALYHPVAQDLRFIVAVLKINNDIERIGDHAANIAKRARYLAKRDPVEFPEELPELAENVKTMVKMSLDALVNADAQLGRQVCISDDTVDEQKRRIIKQLRERIINQQGDQEQYEVLMKLMDVPRHLERIADLSTNIAEEVIYLAEGQISRHKHLLE